VPAYLHTAIHQIFLEGTDNIFSPVRNRKDPPTSLNLCFHTIAAQEGDQIFTKEAMKCPVQKTAVWPVHRDEVIQIPGICQITARLAAHEDLLADFPGPFQEDDMSARFRSFSCGHHAACSAANNYYGFFMTHIFLQFRWLFFLAL
jgi:hypothetical protein